MRIARVDVNRTRPRSHRQRGLMRLLAGGGEWEGPDAPRACAFR